MGRDPTSRRSPSLSDQAERTRGWELPLRDMIGFCDRIMDHSAGLDHDAFSATAVVYDAALWNIVLIGEAASNVQVAVKNDAPEVPWRLMVSARNEIIHRYWRIDDEHVWNIVAEDVPQLQRQLREILDVPGLR